MDIFNALDGLTVPRFQGIKDAGEVKLLENGDQFGHGVNVGLLSQ